MLMERYPSHPVQAETAAASASKHQFYHRARQWVTGHVYSDIRLKFHINSAVSVKIFHIILNYFDLDRNVPVILELAACDNLEEIWAQNHEVSLHQCKHRDTGWILRIRLRYPTHRLEQHLLK